MKRYFAATVIILGITTTLLPVAIRAGSTVSSGLGPADTYFVTQTSLGTPFQVESGRLAETRGTSQPIQSYAQLMVSSHITVNNALTALLKNRLVRKTRGSIWVRAACQVSDRARVRGSGRCESRRIFS